MDKQKLINILSRLYEQSNLSDNYEELNQSLDVIKIHNLVNMYLHYTKPYDEDDSIIIEFIIKIVQNIYNNSGILSPISDEEYDQLYEIMLSITDNQNIVGGNNLEDRPKVNHKYPDLRGTLDKVHFLTNKDKGKDNRKSIEGWISSCENRLGRSLLKEELLVELYPKFDGLSVIFECDSHGNVITVLTRGDTKNNEATELTSFFKGLTFPTYLNWNSDFGIKTEVIMSQENFKKLCKKYGDFKSQRSAVSSILNSKESTPEMMKYLTIIPLRLQNFNTKEIVVPGEPYADYPTSQVEINDYHSLEMMFANIKNYVKLVMEYPIDGIVMRFVNSKLRDELGRDDAINKYEVAFKFQPEAVKTKLIDVDFSIGILGTITPVAKIEPVKMEGNTITSPSLGSMDRFESLQLRKGSEVLIKYDIIPYLFIDDSCDLGTGELIKSPTHCKYCGEELILDPILRCTNNDCPSRVIGKITNYIEKMNIENISIGLVTSLFDHGYLTRIEDLYLLETKKKDIVNIDGFGSKKIEKIIKGINNKKEVFDYILLGSLGIANIGRKIFQKISSIYYIDDIKEIVKKNDVYKLIEIPGIQEKTALKIVSGILQNYQLIEFLEKTLIVKHDKRQYKMKVVFTKIRDKDFEKYLESKDIEVCDKYNKEIDMVICDKSMTVSDKIKKAEKDGKKILPINEAYHYFKYKK